MMANLRNSVPAQIGGAAVRVVNDYKAGISLNVATGAETNIDLPRSNVLEFILGESGSVIVRPSGTEPKVKFYYTAVAKSKDDAEKLLRNMIEQMT